MEHDAWFFIGVFVFIFLIWIATGGPTHPIAFTGPALAEPQELGGGNYLALPRAPFGLGGTYISLPGSSSGGGAIGGGEQATTPPLEGIAFGTPSPYRSFISMNTYVSNASSSDSRDEYVELTVPQTAVDSVTISRWQLVSEATGKSAVIPQGIVVPTSGIVNAVNDIVLAPGERAFLISGRSPIGVSFRENKCIGYLSAFQTFTPALPQNCPIPSDELVAHYGDYYVRDASCLDYVKQNSRCETVLSPPRTLSSACKNFVTEYLNYNGCVRVHKNDADFNGNTWHIYLGRPEHLWRAQHEVVKLWDQTGKTVSAFSY